MDDARSDPPSREADAARAAAVRQTAAATRRAQLWQVVTAARMHLAESQQHRRELSRKLKALREDRVTVRTQERSSRLRTLTQGASNRRLARQQ